MCQSYSKPKVGRFLRHGVHFASAMPHAKCNKLVPVLGEPFSILYKGEAKTTVIPCLELTGVEKSFFQKPD